MIKRSPHALFKLNTETNVWEGMHLKKLKKGDHFRIMNDRALGQYFNELNVYKAHEDPAFHDDLGWSIKCMDV